jgi:putative ABC transport system permease protein
LLLTTAFLRNVLIKEYQFDMDSYGWGGWPYVYAELRNGTDWKQAEQQVNAVAARFSEKDWKENKMSYHYFLQPVRNIHLESNLRYDAGNNGNLAQVKIFAVIGIHCVAACLYQLCKSLQPPGRLNVQKKLQ